MRRINRGHFNKCKESWHRIFLYTIVFFIVYLVLMTSVVPKRYNFIEGDIASEDIKAPIDIVDEEATKEKEKEIADKVGQEFTLKNEVKISSQENVSEFFKKLINLKNNNISESDKIAQLKKITAFQLSENQYKTMLSLTREEDERLEKVILPIIDKVYEKEIKEDQEDDIKYAKAIVDEMVSAEDISDNLKEIIKEMCYEQIKPNYFYDSVKTEEKIKEALKNVSKIMIKKNQIIVKEGEPITHKQLTILSELGLVGENIGASYIFSYIILAIFTIFILLLQYLYVKKEHNDIFRNNKLVLLIIILNLICIILSRFTSMVSDFLVPISCSAILMAALINYKISIIVNLLNLALVSVIVGFNPQIILGALVSILVAAISLRKVTERNDILYTIFYIVIASIIVTLTSGILLSNNIKKILVDMLLAASGALISGVLSLGLLPFLESSFNLLTNAKLLELLNPNTPLLKRLLMEAPGTYHHSVMVGNLAEVAAEAVGANPILARVGAYYHDVGKIKRPFFFGENQLGGANPHSKLNPKLSASIIISHVKDGVELANEYNIPGPIKDFIERHHGTTLVKYFYLTLKYSSENPDEIKEDDFKYLGPRPVSKEVAIVMIADSVEAAVRSINEPTMAKNEEMVII